MSKRLLKKTAPVLLIIALLVGILPRAGLPAQAAAVDFSDSVEAQIRAFADSVDQASADGNAATALAKHGMTQRGQKLTAGKNHALTATLLNSELMQTALAEGCTAAIKAMQQLDLSEMPDLYGNLHWNGADSSYFLRSYVSSKRSHEYRDLDLIDVQTLSRQRNTYDNALDWMAGDTALHMVIRRSKVTAEEAVYTVTCTVSDRFDFSIRNSSGFNKLISGLGALLFREFDWESTVSFELRVPYSCPHHSGTYRWVYDAASQAMVCDTSEGYSVNEATGHTFLHAYGTHERYYELSEAVRLRHDNPWVLEYDVQYPGHFVLAPWRTASITHPSLLNAGRAYLSFWDCERYLLSDEEKNAYGQSKNAQQINKYYGSLLTAYFPYSNLKSYTLRLENQINPDGSNMIYLTVFDTETGVVLLENAPMDSYYRVESWNKTDIWSSGPDDWTDGGNWVSGKDFYINYIGNTVKPFSPEAFELRIWETGKDHQEESFCNTKVTPPTCTEQGYTDYACTACGYQFTADKVDAAGHAPGEAVKENMGKHGSHDLVTYCQVCGEEVSREHFDGYLPGDINSDGSVNNKDTTRLFQYLSGWDVEVTEPALDTNGDGSVNNKDVSRLFQYLSGWDVQIH